MEPYYYSFAYKTVKMVFLQEKNNGDKVNKIVLSKKCTRVSAALLRIRKAARF